MQRIRVPEEFGPGILSLDSSGGNYYLVEVVWGDELVQYAIAKLRVR